MERCISVLLSRIVDFSVCVNVGLGFGFNVLDVVFEYKEARSTYIPLRTGAIARMEYVTGQHWRTTP
jgi:hypothetical protein